MVDRQTERSSAVDVLARCQCSAADSTFWFRPDTARGISGLSHLSPTRASSPYLVYGQSDRQLFGC